jgi:hypothetical protein
VEGGGMKSCEKPGKKWGALSLLVAALGMCSMPGARAQEPSPAAAEKAAPIEGKASTKSYTIELPASQQWVDTKIELRAGEKLLLTVDGSVTDANGKNFGPEGLRRSIEDVVHEYAVPEGGRGAVIAQVGSGAEAHPMIIGESKEYEAPVAGRLFVGINQSMKEADGAQGGFQVRIEVLSGGFKGAAAALVGGPPESHIPGINARLLAAIPRRITDGDGNPGDMVNALLIGEEEDVVQAFTEAEWVKVDRSVGRTLLSGIEDTIKKEEYLTFPMSTLYLFDRPQDYGFAHAEPLRVLMSRNHLRVWKSPYLVHEKPLWCVAATHDIGFERDKRNELVTHKIDPAIDSEREYVNLTLSGTGLVTARGHVMPKDPLIEAKTATGEEFHSDGRILVLVLRSNLPDEQ